MIKVTLKKDNDVIKEFRILGHAKYDVYGKDIVCAGVSSALITTVNACLMFDSNSIYYEEGNCFYLKNIKNDDITNTLLRNLYNILISISKEYKKNIEVKEE